MTRAGQWLLPVFFVLVGAGFFLPFWPLSVLAVVLAGLMGRSIFAVALGLLLDIAWGIPTGILGALMFPATLLALLCIGLRFFANRHLLGKTLPKKLY